LPFQPGLFAPALAYFYFEDERCFYFENEPGRRSAAKAACTGPSVWSSVSWLSNFTAGRVILPARLARLTLARAEMDQPPSRPLPSLPGRRAAVIVTLDAISGLQLELDQLRGAGGHGRLTSGGHGLHHFFKIARTAERVKLAGRTILSFVRVDPEAYRTDVALAKWIKMGVRYALAASRKEVGRS
jgi:hypothetical protein